MGTDQQPQTIEDPETRDGQEIVEELVRTLQSVLGNNNGPVIGANGRPMAIIVGGCSDKVPTVQYGNVVIGPSMIIRWIEDDGLQSVIDAGREAQRGAEFIVGVERRLLQWAIDPASKIPSPVTGDDAFAAPPPGYNPSAAPAHPADAMQQVAENHLAAAQQQGAEVAPATVPADGATGAQVG